VSDVACSVHAERVGDDIAATAPSASRLLLLEQGGPWRGRNAVTHSDLDERLARALLARADDAGVKVHLIRRTSRRSKAGPCAAFLAGPGRLERYALGGPAEALDLDLGGSAGARWDGPLYAVCTHGKRDPCCAARGRPLAQALRAARPEATWEIGHIGGHRYAATFLAFPHGLAFGRVPAAAGPGIVAELERGEIELGYLRGRLGDPWAVQAADVLVRRELGLRGVDEVSVEGVEPLGADAARVRLYAGGQVFTAAVERRVAGDRPLSCGAEAEPVMAYSLALGA
jgi:Sucrase/ferredoxin-like